MWFHKKKQMPEPEQHEPVKQECRHKYRDFDWYMLYSFNEQTKEYEIEIYEPYVCILCKHREDRLLEITKGRGYKDFVYEKNQAIQNYPKLKPVAVVEDEIRDMMMLDPYYLDAYYKLYPERK